MEAAEGDKKKPLFAVAIEVAQPRKTKRGLRYVWEADIRYLHAEDAGEARMMFTAAHTYPLVHRLMRIVGIAPAIGFHVHDDHGEVLSA